MVLKTYVVLCCIVVFALAVDKYDDKYDNIDIEEFIENERLFNNYKKCLLDEGPCTADGKELRDHLDEAIKNGCEMCTDTQKDKSTKMIKFIIDKKLDVWKQLTAKYDPDHVWVKKYEEEARNRGIDLPKE